MLWHWNSLWAPEPGEAANPTPKPNATVEPLWPTAWTPEYALALQVRSWEHVMSASQAWWNLCLTSWPMWTPWWPAATALPAQADESGTGAEMQPEDASPPDSAAEKPHRPRAASRKAATGL